MEKIAIIIEDMRMGGPQKQLLYFLQEVTKSNFHTNTITSSNINITQ